MLELRGIKGRGILPYKGIDTIILYESSSPINKKLYSGEEIDIYNDFPLFNKYFNKTDPIKESGAEDCDYNMKIDLSQNIIERFLNVYFDYSKKILSIQKTQMDKVNKIQSGLDDIYRKMNLSFAYIYDEEYEGIYDYIDNYSYTYNKNYLYTYHDLKHYNQLKSNIDVISKRINSLHKDISNKFKEKLYDDHLQDAIEAYFIDMPDIIDEFNGYKRDFESIDYNKYETMLKDTIKERLEICEPTWVSGVEN